MICDLRRCIVVLEGVQILERPPQEFLFALIMQKMTILSVILALLAIFSTVNGFRPFSSRGQVVGLSSMKMEYSESPFSNITLPRFTFYLHKIYFLIVH